MVYWNPGVPRETVGSIGRESAFVDFVLYVSRGTIGCLCFENVFFIL